VLLKRRNRKARLTHGCQRALAARNNVVIDVDLCRDNVANQAVDIVNAIAAKISQ
jgi:eukaryotic-like serine/threonine-protein kinase